MFNNFNLLNVCIQCKHICELFYNSNTKQSHIPECLWKGKHVNAIRVREKVLNLYSMRRGSILYTQQFHSEYMFYHIYYSYVCVSRVAMLLNCYVTWRCVRGLL